MISKYPRFSLVDLLQVLLEVQFAHFSLKLRFVTLRGLFGEGTLPALLGFLLVKPVHVLFLGLLDTFLSLFFFGFVIGTFLEFFEFLPEAFWLMLNNMESGICIIKMTCLAKS
jgi:hypothetical protein